MSRFDCIYDSFRDSILDFSYASPCRSCITSKGVHFNIVSFDLEYEEFRDISSPRELDNISALGVLSGCLCVINNVLHSTHSRLEKNYSTHIWVMNNKDYSWSKKFTILSWKENQYYCFKNYPLAHLENGKILLHCNYNTLASYDPETEHIVELKMKDKLFDIIPYMKSSVSLKDLGETEAIQVTASAEEEKEKK